jgi:non-heme chloroperoxidase
MCSARTSACPSAALTAKATPSQGLRDSFWLMCMSVGVKGALDCIKAFSETDLTEDLKKIDVPTLKVYPGAPHGPAQTTAFKDTFNNDLMNFIKT